MDFNSLFHPTPETIVSIACTLVIAFVGHRVSIAQIFRKSSEALTHLADYIDTSDPDALKSAMVDAQNSIELVKNLDIAANYSGVKTSPKPIAEVVKSIAASQK